MPDVSKEQIEARIRELIEQEERSLETLTLEDILPAGEDKTIDMKAMFTVLEAIQTEFRQMNRTEKLRLDTFKSYFDEEKQAKRQLLDRIDSLLEKNSFCEEKSMLLSVIETRDYIESFHKALPLAFGGGNSLTRFLSGIIGRRFYRFVQENVSKTLKKIDQSLEKAEVYPVFSDNESFDPSLMMAVETTSDKRLRDKTVAKTVEKGYLCRNKVLRVAKVRVNRIGEDHEPTG